MSYLIDYIRLLRSATTEDDVYGEIAKWQWARFADDAQRQTLATLNSALGFAPSSYRYLQPGHLPTTGVGRLSGLVIVSANPGYREHINLREHSMRSACAAANGEFCHKIFAKYPQLINSTVRYWTYALRMWAMAFAPCHQERRGRDLWATAADESWEIGGIDLLPFHSSRDGVTPLLGMLRGAPLKEVALETLAMICRLKPQPRGAMGRRVVLVSSKAGNGLVNELCADGVLQAEQACYGPPEWKMQLLIAEGGTAVVSLPYQVFSRATPPKYARRELAHWIAHAAKADGVDRQQRVKLALPDQVLQGGDE